MTEIELSDAVAAALGPDHVAMLRGGQLVANPVYQCLACRQLGDLSAEPTAAVLVVTPATMSLSWVHARCGPSEVLTLDQLVARYGHRDDPTPPRGCRGVPDTAGATVIRLGGITYPALIITVGGNLRQIVGPGGRAIDHAVQDMRQLGFGHLDHSGAQPPPILTQWVAVLQGDCLAQVCTPHGPWLDTNPPAPLPADWVAAARTIRRVLLVVTATAMPRSDLMALRVALSDAVAQDRALAALVSVRGV